jgi:transposase
MACLQDIGYTAEGLAHILREARHLAVRTKSETAVNLYDALCKLFSDAKYGLKDSPAPNRLLYQEMMHRLEKMILTYETDWQLEKFITKLGNAKDCMFTFLLHPGVPPTNNTAEQALRESVIHRKIRGLVRNEKGMRMFGNLMTCIMTWNMRGCNVIDEVVKYL